MPYKCSITNCTGNYDCERPGKSTSIYKFPSNVQERQQWINVIPVGKYQTLNPDTARVCRRHWPENATMVKLRGGQTRPLLPPSIFDVPSSSLPTPKHPPRPPKVEFALQNYFDSNDKITSFDLFFPEKQMLQKYPNVLSKRKAEKILFIFLTEDDCKADLIVSVTNQKTLCSPLTFSAIKEGNKVPIPNTILNPNNGLNRYTQFLEAVNFAIQYEVPPHTELNKVADKLQEIETTGSLDVNKTKKLSFIRRQIELLACTKFGMSDYCFALENYPRSSYEQLQTFLVLPKRRRMNSLISSINVESIIQDVFTKITVPQQKYCFLLVDEVKIRPTVAYSGSVLNGFAKNKNDCKATSMLGIMLRCLHGGPSVMLSVTPVHRMDGLFQFEKVKNAAAMVEEAGGTVIGSITDNHKVNMKYCTFFSKRSAEQYDAKHPLDSSRPWFLLYDTVHIFKSIRNNWLTEKNQQLTFDNQVVGKFSDIRELYNAEKGSIFKTTPLVFSAVYPSRLQLQNVKHVCKVFHDKVVAALRISNKADTASVVQLILSWFKACNVASPYESTRFNDPDRAVQTRNSTNLQKFVDIFTTAPSGHGSRRVQALTLDTKRALLQTTKGLIAVCNYLYEVGFEYVLLRSIQSDKIEGEFASYRASTGSNLVMISSDVEASFRKRLTKFSAKFLEKVEFSSQPATAHTCLQTNSGDAEAMENSNAAELTTFEKYSAAYVAGWLEHKCCNDLRFLDETPEINEDVGAFISEVSRGKLYVPHVCTYEFVCAGLAFTKQLQYKVCCRQRLMVNLNELNIFFDFGAYPRSFIKRFSNVLLNGLHKMDKDTELRSVSHTALKKSRLS